MFHNFYSLQVWDRPNLKDIRLRSMTRKRLQRMIGQSKGNQLTTGRTGWGNQSETRPVSLTQRKEQAAKTKAGFGDTLGGFGIFWEVSFWWKMRAMGGKLSSAGGDRWTLELRGGERCDNAKYTVDSKMSARNWEGVKDVCQIIRNISAENL